MTDYAHEHAELCAIHLGALATAACIISLFLI